MTDTPPQVSRALPHPTTCQCLQQMLGAFSLAAAEETVTHLARDAAGRERFYAFVYPVPDDAAAGAVGARAYEGRLERVSR